MIDLEVGNFDEAWTKINRKFLGAEGDRPEDATRALMCYSIDNLIVCHGRPKITFDPGLVVNYAKQKWPHLLRSYMDWAQLDWLKGQTEFRFNRANDNVIPLGYSFKPSVSDFLEKSKRTTNGSCLIGFTFLIDKKRGTININVQTRTAEVTRRMMMDFILFYKIFRKLFYKLEIWNNYEWKISLYYQMMYQSAMFVPVLHTHFDFEKLGIAKGSLKQKGFIGRVQKEIEVCMVTESRGSGFGQMKKIRDLCAADMRGEPRVSFPIINMKLLPKDQR